MARSARSPSNVLITGESSVGKELVARGIHAASPRCDHAFIAVNCAAIPETLLESQLFGHIRGAFTTAVQANPGLFAVANHGTLLLDEIGELPLPLQAKLLRVIEEKRVLPVGATKPVLVDVRIIASTNHVLACEVEAGRFREDLFYRLSVVHLKLPPLRERRGDIPLLVDHLVDRLNAKLGTRFLGVEREALRALTSRPWKGNVRELENVLERAMVLGSGDLISLECLSPWPTEPPLTEHIPHPDRQGPVSLAPGPRGGGRGEPPLVREAERLVEGRGGSRRALEAETEHARWSRLEAVAGSRRQRRSWSRADRR